MNNSSKKSFLLLILVSMSIIGFSQVSYIGTVLDEQQIPIEYANVVVYSSNDSTFIKGRITDVKGAFNMELEPQNNYYVEIKFLGYETKTIKIGSSTNLGVTILESTSQTLDEIVISAKKQKLIRKNDRLIFNIDQTPVQDMGSAVDVLQVTPNIIIRDNQLKMLGKNNVRVMVNNKMIPLQGDDLSNYLSSINSSNIKAVEIITTPPSEFESEGNGGIVNIILKKPLNDFWSIMTRLSGTKRSKFSYSDNVALNIKKKNIYLTLSISQGAYVKNNIYNNAYYYPTETWVGKGPEVYKDNYLNYRFAITQNITDRWEVGANYTGTKDIIKDETDNVNAVYDIANTLQKTYISNGLSKQHATTNAFNIYNTFKIDSTGQNVSLDFDYYNSSSNKDGSNIGKVIRSENSSPNFANDTNIKYDFSNYSSKIDYTLPLKGLNIKFGGKISLSKTDNDFKFYNTLSGTPILDQNQSNIFNYKENIFAGYVSTSKQLTEKISTKIGLRAEKTVTDAFTQANMKHIDNDYFKILPTLYFTYKMSDQKTISFNLNKRLNRPNFESLDPFKIILNPFNTVQGNPFLKPSYMTNMELIFNTGKNEFKIYAQKLDDDFGQISEINPSTKVVNYTYKNYINSLNLGMTNTYIYDKLNWFTSYNTVDVGYSKVSSPLDGTIGHQEGFNAFMQSQNYIHLNTSKTLSLGVNYFYVFPSKVQLYQSTGYGPLDLSMTLKLLDGDLNISMAANDVLNTSRPLISLKHNGVKATFQNYYDSRSIKLNVRYTFGNKSIGTKSSRFGNNDIRNRT